MQEISVKITVENEEELTYFTQIFFLNEHQICSISNYIPENEMEKPEPEGYLLWRGLRMGLKTKVFFPFSFTIVLETKRELAWLAAAINLAPGNAERAADHLSLKKLLDNRGKLSKFFDESYELWRELNNLLKEV